MRYLVPFLSVLLFASPAFAQYPSSPVQSIRNDSGSEKSDRSNDDGTLLELRPSVRQIVQGSSSAIDTKSTWKLRYDEAEARRKSGKHLFWYGMAINGAGFAAALIGSQRTSVDITSSGVTTSTSSLTTVGTIAMLGGGGLSLYGGIKWLTAGGNARDLEQEGRSKGYLTVVPTKDGVIARVAFALR